MGVPAFFRWLSRKYPSVIIECNENKQVDPDTGRNIYGAYFLHFKHKTIEEEYPQVGRNTQAHLTALVMAMNMDPLENRLRARRRCAFLVGSAHVPALPTQLHDSGAPNRPTNAAISVQLCQDWVSL